MSSNESAGAFHLEDISRHPAPCAESADCALAGAQELLLASVFSWQFVGRARSTGEDRAPGRGTSMFPCRAQSLAQGCAGAFQGQEP